MTEFSCFSPLHLLSLVKFDCAKIDWKLLHCSKRSNLFHSKYYYSIPLRANWLQAGFFVYDLVMRLTNKQYILFQALNLIFAKQSQEKGFKDVTSRRENCSVIVLRMLEYVMS